MKHLTTLALIAGLGTVVGLFLSSGIDNVAAAAVGAGWGVLAVVVARAVAVAWAGLGWHVVFPAGAGVRLRDCVSLRFVREGINTLLPVAQVGGDFVGARLLARRGAPGGLAGASMFVDLMTQALTQLLFTVAGLALLLRLQGDGPVARAVAGGLVVAVPALAAFCLIQHRGGHRLIRAAVDRFAAAREWRALGAVDGLYDGLRRLYAGRTRIVAALGIHWVGWMIGTVEVWLCLHFMGYPVSFLEAMVIESLAQAVRGAAFAIPGALGAQEGGLIALCALFGIPVEAALALSLVKRMADLLVGVPGLVAWHLMEGRGRPAEATPAEGIAALRHRLGRAFEPPLVATALGLAANRPGGVLRPTEQPCGDLKKCA